MMLITAQQREAVERLTFYRSFVQKIDRLLKRPLKIKGPTMNVTAKVDDNPGSFVPKSNPDAERELQRIVERNRMIAAYMLEVDEIESALSVLTRDESLILIMRCVDNISMSGIAGALGYASRQTVYNIYDRAMEKFSCILAENV